MRHATLSLVVTTALLASSASAQEPSTQALPTDALVKQWWQFTLAIPNAIRTQLGKTRAACGLGQRGSVWFLSSDPTGAATVTRDCTVPRGVKLFVPLVTAVCTPFPGETLAENIQICREAVDPYDQLEFTIDGKKRNDLIERRAQSQGFAAWFPEGNIFDIPGQLDVPAGIYISVAEGHFALVDALPVGEHVIRARAVSTTDPNTPKFDVTFRLSVVAPTSVTPR